MTYNDVVEDQLWIILLLLNGMTVEILQNKIFTNSHYKNNCTIKKKKKTGLTVQKMSSESIKTVCCNGYRITTSNFAIYIIICMQLFSQSNLVILHIT